MRVVVVVVVMDDVVGGEWTSKIRHLSALWNVLCASLRKVILGYNTYSLQRDRHTHFLNVHVVSNEGESLEIFFVR